MRRDRIDDERYCSHGPSEQELEQGSNLFAPPQASWARTAAPEFRHQMMQRAIINAFLLTLVMSLLVAICIFGMAINVRAVSSANALRRKQGLPPVPLWYESLWARSPSLVLSIVYTAVSVTFAVYLLEFSAFAFLKLKNTIESPYALYEQCTPKEFWIGFGIWLTPLLAALFIIMRSATRLLAPAVGADSGRIPDA